MPDLDYETEWITCDTCGYSIQCDGCDDCCNCDGCHCEPDLCECQES